MHPPKARRSDIEGLRAVAVVLVLLYHAQVEWFAAGFLGVDVFFVISGFLITGSLVNEAESNGGVRLASFYARRARRLLPASVLVLSTTAIATRILLPVTMWQSVGSDITASATYLVNWRFAARSVDYLAEDVLPSPVLHFWSLAIEEQFYLVWPLLILAALWIAGRRRISPRTAMMWGLVGVVVVPSFVWSVVMTGAEPARSFFDTGTRLWELAVGGMAALMGPWVPQLHTRTAAAAKAGAVATIVGFALLLDDSAAWPGWLALGATLPTVVLLLLGGREGDAVERGLALAPMQRVGAWSYSLYLWHWPPLAVLGARWGGLSVAQAVMIVTLSTLPAVASHYLVENPIRYGRILRASPRLSLSFGANLSLVGALAGVLLVLATTLSPANGPSAAPSLTGSKTLPAEVAGDRESHFQDRLVGVTTIVPTPTQATSDVPRIYPDGCQVGHGDPQPVVCAYGDLDADVHVGVVGDSKAGQWMSALITIAERNGWQLRSITKSACELTTTMPERDDQPAPDCLNWSQRTIDLLAQDPPDVVLVSQGSSKAWSDDPHVSGKDEMIKGMVGAYRAVERHGSRVVLLLDNHYPDKNVYECVARHRDDLRPCMFERIENRGGRTVQLEAARIGEFEVIDMADRICPTSPCLPVIGGILVYRQGSHLTSTYAESTTDVLEARIRRAARLHSTSLRRPPT